MVKLQTWAETEILTGDLPGYG